MNKWVLLYSDPNNQTGTVSFNQGKSYNDYDIFSINVAYYVNGTFFGIVHLGEFSKTECRKGISLNDMSTTGVVYTKGSTLTFSTSENKITTTSVGDVKTYVTNILGMKL